jgi:hypothetical protein
MGRRQKVELCCGLIVRYPLDEYSSYRWPVVVSELILAGLLRVFRLACSL